MALIFAILYITLLVLEVPQRLLAAQPAHERTYGVGVAVGNHAVERAL
jgi:hypothetical protein